MHTLLIQLASLFMDNKPKEKKFQPIKVPVKHLPHEDDRKDQQVKFVAKSKDKPSADKEIPVAASFQKKLNTKEKIALDLLVEGYPQTYVDFFYMSNSNLPNIIQKKNYYGQLHPAPQIQSSESQIASQLLDLLKIAEDLVRTPGSQKSALQKYLDVAQELLEQDNHRASAYFFKRVVDKAKQFENQLFLITARHGLGKCYDRQKKTSQAVKILQSSLDDAMTQKSRKEEDMQQMVRRVSHTLIGIYLKLADRAQKFQQNNTKALQFYERCLDVAKKARQEEEEGNICNKIGQLYYKAEDYKKSVDYQEKYLQIIKNSLVKGDQGRQKTELSLRTKLMEGHAALAKNYLKMKEIALAQTHLFQYNTLAKDNRLYNAEADSSFYLAKLYEQKMQPAKAIEHYRKYFEAAKLQRNQKNRQLVDKARVTYAIAKANDTIDRYIKLVANSESHIAELLQWKSKHDHK